MSRVRTGRGDEAPEGKGRAPVPYRQHKAVRALRGRGAVT